MEIYQNVVNTIALSAGTAWASGINLYATILALGVLGGAGYMDLPASLEVLSHPLVLGAAGLMYVLEFFADKIRGFYTLLDFFHTFLFIPAGAVLAASALGDVSGPIVVAAGIIGGSIAASSHAAKTAVRAGLNVSPEPFTGWSASIMKDVVTFGSLWAVLNHPVVFLFLFVLFIAILVWMMPKIIRILKKAIGLILAKIRGESREQEPLRGTGGSIGFDPYE